MGGQGLNNRRKDLLASEQKARQVSDQVTNMKATTDGGTGVVAQVASTVERLRSLSPLWDMHCAGVDLASVRWAAH